MADKGTIGRFLHAASRRHRLNLALEYIAIAAAVGASGLILLLLLGTEIFNWYWPLGLFVVALSTGFVLARRRRLTEYRLAQVVDDRLHLKDRLATLVFFRDNECGSESCLHTVELQATERLEGEDVRRAVPVSVPRYAYVSLALLAAAGGLTGLRYGMLHTLDLKAPIAQIDFGGFGQPANVQAATKKSVLKERLEEQLRQLGLDVDDNMGLDENVFKPIETQVPAISEAGKEMQDPSGKRQAATTPESAEDGEGTEPGEKSTGDGNDAGDAAASDKPQQAKPQNPPKDPKQGQQGSQDNLMSKMKDALANLLNKLKSQTSQTQESASLNQSEAKGRQQSNEQGMQSKSKTNGEGQPSPDQQGQEGPGEKAPGDQSRAGDRSADQPGNQDSKTGMGRQDGAKDIRDAEQLAAMGKLSAADHW